MDQYLVLEVSPGQFSATPFNLNQVQLEDQILDSLEGQDPPMNVTTSMLVWKVVETLILNLLIPDDDVSFFYPSVIANNLSSITLSYDGSIS